MDVVVVKTGDRMIEVTLPNVKVASVTVPFRKAEDGVGWINVGPIQFEPMSFACEISMMCLVLPQGISAVQFESPVELEPGMALRLEASSLCVMLND